MIRRRQPKRYEDDDDNPLDAHGVLKDGRTLRTPMYLMDDLQRAIAEDRHTSGRDTSLHDAIKQNRHQMVTDVFGTTAGLSRPGYRLLHDLRSIMPPTLRMRWRRRIGCTEEQEVARFRPRD